jgi:hypothetical protein
VDDASDSNDCRVTTTDAARRTEARFLARGGGRHVSSTGASRVLSSASGGGFSRLEAVVFGLRTPVAQEARPVVQTGVLLAGPDAVLGG